MDNEIYLKRKYQYFSLEDKLNTPLELYQAKVHPDWIDFNDHMTEGFYGVPFGLAAREFLFNIGFKEYVEKTNCTIYAVQNVIKYIQELNVNAPIRITTQIINVDKYRLNFFHHMYHADEGFLAATEDKSFMHYSRNVSSFSAMENAIYKKFKSLILPMSKESGSD